MRLMLASLIAALGVAPFASAQTPPGPASPPVAPPPASAPAVAAPTPPPPPAPPAPPTDPVAIALLSILQSVCQPALSGGGDLGKLAKADGWRKNGESWVMNGRGFKLTLLAPGSNPDQCHIDIVHPVDPQAPAAAIVVALHNWAAVERGWSLYRNDKNVSGAQELTTRSWEHDETGRHEALVITTFRRSDGRPLAGSNDTSTVIYSSDKT
ncbi:MAG TPA: hypothetical protein VG166_07065 [Caulobacteraceae bacterium]|jgi:hypothetical protein|nr:hypothetical protein [Caulobacteraceae bacterium]